MRPARGPAWQQFLRENLQWMIASIVLAFGIWIVATVQTNPVEQRVYPRAIVIEFRLGENMIIVGAPGSETATVTVRAQQSVWDELRNDQINVVADLREMEAGSHNNIELEAWLDDGLAGRVVNVNPGEINVTLARLDSQRVPVEIDVSQEPPSGFSYPEPQCDFTEVTARGPIESLNNIRAVARLNLSDDRAPVSRLVSLFPVNEEGRTAAGVTLEPAQITCEVNITQNEGVSEVSVLPIIEGVERVPAGYIYEGWEVEPSTIIVTGSPSAIRDLNGVVETQPISVEGATSTFARAVNLNLPLGVFLDNPNQTMNVTVKIGTVRGNQQYNNIPVEVIGLTAGLEAEILPETVTVFAVGPQPLLQALTNNDLRVTVDLTNLTPGSYPVTATASVRVESLAEQVTPETQFTVQPPEINVVISDPTPDTPTPTASPTP